MVLESLGSSLKDSLKRLAGRGFVDKEVVEELVRDIQRSLLKSDVNVKLVFELSRRIKERSLKEKPAPGLTGREHVINVVYEELVNFLGKEEASIPLRKTKILLVGLFGSGKTTTAGKLARFYQKKGLKPCLVGCDTTRPAAFEQLQQVGEKIGVPVFGDPSEKDSSKVLKEALKKTGKFDVVIVDSSGRDALNESMIDEIKKLNEILKPEETLLVIPAEIGQQAEKQAHAFKENLNITGVIVTRMDGTAKGGGALSACAVTGAPVKFIGTGEKFDAFERYNPERFVSRLIGFGDLKTLLEKAQEAGLEKRAEKMLKGDFDLNDFYEQIESMKGMGSLSQIMDMIPGLKKAKIPKGMLDLQEEKMKRFKYIIQSMTPEERAKPEIINSPRISRIAKGSGTSEEEVRELLRLFKQSKKAMKMLKGGKRSGQLQALLKQFGL